MDNNTRKMSDTTIEEITADTILQGEPAIESQIIKVEEGSALTAVEEVIPDVSMLDISVFAPTEPLYLICRTCGRRPFIDERNRVAWCKQCAGLGEIIRTDQTVESAPTVKEPGEPVNDFDNIDDDLTDEQIAQMVRQMEEVSESAKKTPSVAELYMMSAGKGSKNTIDYFDFVDEYDRLPPNRMLDGPKSFHPTSSGYKYQHKTDFELSDTPDDIIDNIAEAVDRMGSTVELVHECTKGTDQLINDMYERQVALADELDEVKDITKITCSRLHLVNSEIASLKSGQKEITETLHLLTKNVLEMREWLKNYLFPEE